MKGLLLKDLYNLSGQLKIYACFPFFAALLAYQAESLDVVALTCCFLSMLVVISACAYDEMANFDSYALTLPITRKDLVLSKYELSLLSAVIIIALSFLSGLLLLQIFPERFADSSFQMFSLELLSVTIAINMLLCIFLPLIFRFGTEKARILLMVIFLSFGGLGYFISTFDLSWISMEFLSALEQYGLYILAAIAIFMEAISIWISNYIVSKKEL